MESMALFLTTEESLWMTGQILTVDGGHSKGGGINTRQSIENLVKNRIIDPSINLFGKFQ